MRRGWKGREKHMVGMRSKAKDGSGPRALRLRKYYQLYLFLLIPLLWLIIFHYTPMSFVQVAFRRFKIRDGIWGSEWVGLYHFEKFFSSYQFGRVLKNTLTLSLYSLAAGFPLPILLAVCLNALRGARFKRFVQTVTYIPHFISTVVLVGMVIQFLNPRIGLYGTLAQWLTGTQPRDILGSAQAFSHIYVWSDIWQNMGWSSIIYMAALSSVDAELHEAAEIDGASRLKRCLYIDFPSILPTAVILLIMSVGNVMSVGFEKAYLMQNQLNLSASEVISTYVYKVSIANGNDFSYGTAIGLFNSMVNLVLLFSVNAISRKVTSSSLW